MEHGMSVTLTVSNEIVERLEALPFDQPFGVEEKLKSLLRAEYQRRLARYNLTVRQLAAKYKMDFAAFEQQEMTKQLGYSWEVESDAIAWETAVDGIQTMQEQLRLLESQGRSSEA
jgi:hypothetical protein